MCKLGIFLLGCFLTLSVSAQTSCPANQAITGEAINSGAVCSTVAFISALTGTTGSIGGGLLGIGGTSSGTVSVSGAIVGKPCQANASDGSAVGFWKVDCKVGSAGVITVTLTGLASLGITPAAVTYNVIVFQ